MLSAEPPPSVFGFPSWKKKIFFKEKDLQEAKNKTEKSYLVLPLVAGGDEYECLDRAQREGEMQGEDGGDGEEGEGQSSSCECCLFNLLKLIPKDNKLVSKAV